MTVFFERLLEVLPKHAKNKYTDNYDAFRFGPDLYPAKQDSALVSWLKKKLFRNRVHMVDFERSLKGLARISPYETKLQKVYDSLQNEESRDLLLDLVLYRILGNTQYKLKTNTPERQARLAEVDQLANRSERVDPGFLNMLLHKYDLKPLGYDLKLFFTSPGVYVDFVLEQYRYKTSGIDISAKPGDVVIDAGGCWGDTALYFADRVGRDGQVHSFEFIPGNISIFEQNVALNPQVTDRIRLVRNPVWSESGIPTYYKDNGPGSVVAFEPMPDATGKTETISIDDYVARNQISRVDFIKMDIEGAEGAALKGARKTIERFKPKLAIAIYHSTEQFVDIPKWINDLNLGYELYIDHFTIHSEETVLFARVR